MQEIPANQEFRKSAEKRRKATNKQSKAWGTHTPDK
jgi:hypothetical protein